jgi:uncharacterized protein YqjF (DUF2071 family)
MCVVRIHGLGFCFETQGLKGSADNAVDKAVQILGSLSATTAFALWAAARHRGHGDFDGRRHPVDDKISSIEYRAVQAATKKWADNSACYLDIAARDPD